MHELFKKDLDLGSAHSVAPSTGNVLSWWTTTGSELQQSSPTRNLSFKMGVAPEPFQPGKQLGFQFHDQDSSSTQSTGQSYPELASVGESKNSGTIMISKEPGCSEMLGKPEEGRTQSTLSSQDYFLPSSYVDHTKSSGTVPFTYPDPYASGLIAAYGTHPMLHPQMMCMTPTRVPLPLDLQQDEPIYVNAKQYRAILRRRQLRAKLEAQNKVAKLRKPYLHESRHRHALNRARGPGGRFLNAKKVPESKTTSTTDGRDNSSFDQSKLTATGWESELHLLENYKEGDQPTSSSDIMNASNVDNMNIFHQQELGFSFYASHIGGPMQHGISQSLNKG